ncbi:DUF3034 family protein [Marinomonas sp. M1K-6]|uniref:DUF3034 family protein n=1 Tax=Marinomonas profundi TaxID=2726122 RepID=A0A847QX58_9GAMM|nr:DUF3034 family protein [Marinomonas profundi]NLQ16929.1 DUF3034 family protein [Marinomonas profundi]UDV02659.1 DUF3034 family protein [Marinomonas profundi]
MNNHLILKAIKQIGAVSAVLWIAPVMAGEGKLLATAGLSQIEGSGGGGLVPWATLAGYDSQDETAASFFVSDVNVSDYRLTSIGVATSFYDRVELSYAQQTFVLPASLITGRSLESEDIKQDVVGVKVRLYGDAVYSTYPQVSVGLQHKQLDSDTVASVLGAKDDSGTDFYIAATKVHLGAVAGYNLVWNATARATKANEMGLLGYGGPDNDSYQLMLEGSVGLLLSPNWVVGMEYRQKPSNLSSVAEDDWTDFFVSYLPNKNVSMTAAYVDLGTIATQKDQKGIYLSMTGYLW